MHVVEDISIRQWYRSDDDLAAFTHTIGRREQDDDAIENLVELPPHLQFTVRHLAKTTGKPVPRNRFDSISFFSLCKGLFLPFLGFNPDRIAQVFGIKVNLKQEPLADLAKRFLSKDLGLPFVDKMGCLLGDPFGGKKSGMKRDSLIRLLRRQKMLSRQMMLDRLTKIGDVAILFAEQTSATHGNPPLTALEVLETLRALIGTRINEKLDILSGVYQRCGKLEAYMLTKLLLRQAGYGADHESRTLAELMASVFNVNADHVEHAMALTSPMQVARTLQDEGAAGLQAIQLKPLSPVRPMLAGGSADDIAKFPVWVERKYDGVRILLHKSVDSTGAMLGGAYTRNRHDWLEMIPGLDSVIRAIPGTAAIVDGELFGTVFDTDGPRPATVYEVYAAIQGEPIRPVNYKYAAFDLLYWQGHDLTSWPLRQRRQQMMLALSAMSNMNLPIPVVISDGHMAQSREDVNRLFHHFRSQGYEGIIAKSLDDPYILASRSPNWCKRKPEITLDLVLLAGLLAVTSKENAGTFGSYLIGARQADGTFAIIGDVVGLDRARDVQLQGEIMRQGLLTGKRIERVSVSGVRPGLEFKPVIVVTVAFEGVVRANREELPSLRSPRIISFRADKTANECDTLNTIERLLLDQRLG